MKKILILLVFLQALGLAGTKHYYPANGGQLSARQRRLFKNSFWFAYQLATPQGDNSILMDNGTNLNFGYKRRFFRSLTFFVSFDYASFDAFNKLYVFQNDVDFTGISELSARKLAFMGGLKLYQPLIHRVSVNFVAGVGLINHSYNPTFTAGEEDRTDEFKQELNDNVLAAYSYPVEGSVLAIKYGAGLEWLFTRTLALDFDFAMLNEINNGFNPNMLMGVSLNFYFKEFNIANIAKDLFK